MFRSYHSANIPPGRLRTMREQVGDGLHTLNRGAVIPAITMPDGAPKQSAGALMRYRRSLRSMTGMVPPDKKLVAEDRQTDWPNRKGPTLLLNSTSPQNGEPTRGRSSVG